MTLITSKEAGMAYPHKADDRGVVVEKNPNADQLARDPEKAEAVTGRPNDLVKGEVRNTTLADRARARQASAKAVSDDDTENKAVGGAKAKTARRK